MFFQLLSTIKVNLVTKIMQSAYLCVIFHVKHKNFHFSRFKPDFSFLITSKMATVVSDVTGLQQRPTPKIYLILLRRSMAFH